MDLDEIRSEIDRVDEQMTALFVKRMELSRRAGQAKGASNSWIYNYT